MTIFTLGTRGSLLAVTQSTLVKNQLELYYPQHKFQIKTIKTQGDVVTNKPLWQLEGKDFFTKELDDALNLKEVDFVVHSCKDLSTERPNNIKLAAITQRTFPNDVLLITKEKLAQIQNKKLTNIIIGTSSPRRHYLLEKNLKYFLPFGKNLDIKFATLRGNVNTRIEKLRDGNYDLICLAGAGLNRLAAYPDSNLQLKVLLNNILIKFLPTNTFPCAPAQGALAIECLASNTELADLLDILNCQKTTIEVNEERKIFKQYGGGCHLALGVYVKCDETHKLKIMTAKGCVDNSIIDLVSINNQNMDLYKEKISNAQNIFIGLTPNRIKELNLSSKFLADETKKIIKYDPPIMNDLKNTCLYLTSEHNISTFTDHVTNVIDHPTLWVAGSNLHQKLSQLGYWVSGDNDSQGNTFLLNTYQSSLSQYFFQNKPIIQLSYKGELP